MCGGCGESFQGVHPSKIMIHRMGCTLVHKGSGELLQGVGAAMIHHMGMYTHPQGMR